MIKTKNAVFVPEKHFADLPKKFSETSRIIGVETDEHCDGIIFDSLKDIEHALRFYNGEEGYLPESRATSDNLIQEVGKSSGLLGIGLLFLAGGKKSENRDFIGTMMQQIKAGLADRGRHEESYDYDGMGTNFFKTSVRVEVADGKFILAINAAYVGDEPEKKLAKKLERTLALRKASVSIAMSVVDNWWFKINIEEALRKVLPLTKKDLNAIVASICSDGGSNFKFTLEQGDEKFSIGIGLRCDRHFRVIGPDGKQNRKDFLSADGMNIAGAAWRAYRNEGEDAKPVEPRLILSFKYYGSNSWPDDPIVSSEKAKLLLQLRDEIAMKVREKIK
jgi:hypothetical protein